MGADRWWHCASGKIKETNECGVLMVRDDGLKLYVAKVDASREEMEATARLFSAAPDLLKTCKEMFGYLCINMLAQQDEGWEHEMLESARSAIAKVKGESDDEDWGL